jgi:hypothetical protein
LYIAIRRHMGKQGLEFNDHFHSIMSSRSPKGRVRVQHLRKAKGVGEERVRFYFAGIHKLQEQARGNGVDKARGDRCLKRA